jgi:hypothetical protein
MTNEEKLNKTYEFSTDYEFLYNLIFNNCCVLGIATNPKYGNIELVTIKMENVGVKEIRFHYSIESADTSYCLGYQSFERFVVMCKRANLKFIPPNNPYEYEN